MHRIKIVMVGRDKDRWVSDACAHYETLLKKFARIEFETVGNARGGNLSPVEIKRDEAGKLQKKLAGSFVAALTDAGDKFDSPQIAAWLERTLTNHSNRLAFVIGGPYGLDDSILSLASQRLSLSPLTFSHQLVRPILLEQLYRAFTILNGGDYHK